MVDTKIVDPVSGAGSLHEKDRSELQNSDGAEHSSAPDADEGGYLIGF
jgi:hypothetical protein